MSLLVVLEHYDGRLVEAAVEALTAARGLADQLNEPLQAVLVPDEAAVEALGELATEAGRYGATAMYVAHHELLRSYGPDAWASSVHQLAQGLEAEVIIATGTDRGNEVMANLAARTDQPFVANCVSFEPGLVWTMTRAQWGGSLLEDVELDAECVLFSVASHAVPAEPLDLGSETGSEAGAAEIVGFEVELDELATTTMVVGRDVLSQGVTLATSPVVVSGGRGVGSAEAFAPLEELAELLGGVVGCSRAVTNNGWRPHRDQVGQTGTRIAPELYIATGISGAIQHWVGAAASKKILAINTDPEANMVTRADYAVLADLHTVVPAISAEIRRRRG